MHGRCVLDLMDKHLWFMVPKLPSPSCNYVKYGPAVALSSSASCVEKVAATLSLPFLAPDLKDALGQSGGGGMDLGGPGPD